MAIVFKRDELGGFVVGDTETRHTSYAHPLSPFAGDSVSDPARVARVMARTANTNPVVLPADFLERYDERNWSILRREGGVVSVMP